MLGTLLDLLAGVVILLSLFYFGWLGVAGIISPALVGGRSRFGLLAVGVFGCAVSLYLMNAIRAEEPEPEPAPVAASTPESTPEPPQEAWRMPDTPITQWIVESDVAAAAGERGLLRIGVSCRGSFNWILALGVVEDLTGADGFQDQPRRAGWRWDGRGPYPYRMTRELVDSQYVLLATDDAPRIVSRLRGREVVEVGVETLLGREIDDIFGLEGAVEATDALGCGEPDTAERRPAEPASPFDTDTEAGIVAMLLQPYLGDSVEAVLRAMLGYDPVTSRSGERRLFTYRFDDGSGLVLVFVPAGGPGTGLVLDEVNIR